MDYIFEIDYYNVPKHGEMLPGDTFLMDKTKDMRRIATLADGMGSGVKANVLSQITAAMAQKFFIADFDCIHVAETIMETLPVCSKRKISYSTFTTVNINIEGLTHIVEYGNPKLLLFRKGDPVEFERKEKIIKTNYADNKIYYSEIKLEPGDRLVFFSDGVSQAGIGTRFPLGWEEENVRKFINMELNRFPNLSAKTLTKIIVEQALEYDNNKAIDDITCACVYYRKARKTLLVTGPPSNKSKDKYIVERFKSFDGNKVIAGGTTSKIIAKGLGKEVEVDMKDLGSDIPPRAKLEGANLVTEGMLTINKAIKILKEEDVHNLKGRDAAYALVNILINSDYIHFLVGTAINEAHQNPDMPVELGLRRISINKLANILRDKYFKEIKIEYV